MNLAEKIPVTKRFPREETGGIALETTLSAWGIIWIVPVVPYLP